MPNPSPTDMWRSAVTVNTTANTVTFKYADNTISADDIGELSDATVIDGRTILYGLLERAAEWYETVAIKPEKMRVVRSGTLQDVAGETYLNRTYNVTFRVVAGNLPLQPET